MRPVCVIGNGAWGTALALHLHREGHAVRIWGPFEAEIADAREAGENRRYLPGLPLPAEIAWTSDPAVAAADAGTVVAAVPSRFFGATVARFAAPLPADALVVSVTKGLDPETGARMSEVARAALAPRAVAVLSGPSFAEEVARGLPAALVAPSPVAGAAETVQARFGGERFRVYTSDDCVGVELGGVLKNVIAIAAGASDALDFGTNARAALITRGLAEMTRLGVALGAHPATFAGLSGLGDLVLTCTGPLSRNRRVGERIGGGESVEAILTSMTQVAEGVSNCATVRRLARAHGVAAPIAGMVYRVLFEGFPPRDALAALMRRDPRPERDETTGADEGDREESEA